MTPSATTCAALQDLVSTFNELNSPVVEELDSEPSPLEFMRFVSRNAPFVVRGAASTWKATRLWNRDYLTSALDGQTVNVAVTPNGNADAPTFSPTHGGTVLAKPHEEPQLFDGFLASIIQQETGTETETEPHASDKAEVRYAQTQNDNLRGEYLALFPDVQKDIPFARIALQKPPDAINLWVGNSKSVTALHKDNFENLFVQIRGSKHFVLLPPVCQSCVNERAILPASYRRNDRGFSLDVDDGAGPVPFPTWDPDQPLVNPTALSHLARPLRVTLRPGDMLYLPAMWYHKVTQSCSGAGDEGFVVAVNYWYDMEFRGHMYPIASLLRALDGLLVAE